MYIFWAIQGYIDVFVLQGSWVHGKSRPGDLSVNIHVPNDQRISGWGGPPPTPRTGGRIGWKWKWTWPWVCIEILQHFCQICSPPINRQERTHRGYKLLIQHIPPLEEKLRDLDIQELSLYFRDVWFTFSSSSGDSFMNWNDSYSEERLVPEPMMQPIWSLPLLAGSLIFSSILVILSHLLIRQNTGLSMSWPATSFVQSTTIGMIKGVVSDNPHHSFQIDILIQRAPTYTWWPSRFCCHSRIMAILSISPCRGKPGRCRAWNFSKCDPCESAFLMTPSWAPY